MTEEQRLQQTHTPCRDCAWAQWGAGGEKDEDGEAPARTQTGCFLGRLSVYEERGQVVPAKFGGDFFSVVNGRNCWAKRTEAWREKHGRDAPARLKDEMRVRCAFVILCDDGDWALTLLSAEEGEIRPSEVVLVTRGDGADVRKRMEGCPMPCVLTRCLEDGATDAQLVDMGVAMVQKSGWYAIFRGGRAVPEDFLSSVDRAVNDGMAEWACLTGGEDHNADVVSMSAHRSPLFCGNADSDVGPWMVDKVRDYSCCERLNLFEAVEAVVPSMRHEP